MTIVTPATVALKVAKKAPAVKAKTTLSPKAIRAAKMFSNAKAAIKLAEDRKERAEAILREELGDSFQIGTTEDGLKVVEVVASSRTGYDKETLLNSFPEAEAAAFRRTNYTYLKTV